MPFNPAEEIESLRQRWQIEGHLLADSASKEDGNRHVGGGVPTEAQFRDAQEFVDMGMGPINRKAMDAIFKKVRRETAMTDKNAEALREIRVQLRDLETSLTNKLGQHFSRVAMAIDAIEKPIPTPVDHRPRLHSTSSGLYHFSRNVGGKCEVFNVQDGWAPRNASTWSSKSAALRDLAKATGYEIRVIPTSTSRYGIESGTKFLMSIDGNWITSPASRQHILLLPRELAEATRDGLNARGEFPQAMCDTSGVLATNPPQNPSQTDSEPS
jgi:hypothetical protein